jgi:hypothetical protein
MARFHKFGHKKTFVSGRGKKRSGFLFSDNGWKRKYDSHGFHHRKFIDEPGDHVFIFFWRERAG